MKNEWVESEAYDGDQEWLEMDSQEQRDPASRKWLTSQSVRRTEVSLEVEEPGWDGSIDDRELRPRSVIQRVGSNASDYTAQPDLDEGK